MKEIKGECLYHWDVNKYLQKDKKEISTFFEGKEEENKEINKDCQNCQNKKILKK